VSLYGWMTVPFAYQLTLLEDTYSYVFMGLVSVNLMFK